MPSHKTSSPNYAAMIFDLMGLASLLFVPRFTLTEQNWRMVYFGLLLFGWIFILHFIWELKKNLVQPYEKNLFWTLLVLSMCIIGFLSFGTVTFFTKRDLQEITGKCSLSALVKEDFERYRIHVRGNNSLKNFDIEHDQFNTLLHKDQYVVNSNDFILYPCQYEDITVEYIPHFDFFVRRK